MKKARSKTPAYAPEVHIRNSQFQVGPASVQATPVESVVAIAEACRELATALHSLTMHISAPPVTVQDGACAIRIGPEPTA